MRLTQEWLYRPRVVCKIIVIPVPASLISLCCLDGVNRIVLINTVVIGVLLYIKQPYGIPHWWPRRRTDIRIQEAPGSSQGKHTYRAAVRLPPFWPDRPGMWFAQAEAQFALASVTSEKKKFNYVISQLEYRHAAGVEDKIIGAPRWPPAHLPSETTIFPWW